MLKVDEPSFGFESKGSFLQFFVDFFTLVPHTSANLDPGNQNIADSTDPDLLLSMYFLVEYESKNCSTEYKQKYHLDVYCLG